MSAAAAALMCAGGPALGAAYNPACRAWLPRIKRVSGAWHCWLPGTKPGYGVTPKLAYDQWRGYRLVPRTLGGYEP